jgi:hypothetical protein
MSRGTTEPEEDPSVLEKYILNSTGTRGEETAKMKTDQNNGSTYDLNFIIRPKLEKTAVNKPKKSQ